MPSVLAQESVTPHCNALNGEPIGYAQSYVALGRGRMVKKKRSRSTRNRPVNGECITISKGLGTKLVRALVELLFNDPEVTKIQTGPSPSNLRAIRCYEKSGFERQRNHPRWSSRTWFKHASIRANTQCCLTLSIEGDVQGLAPWPPLMSNVKHHEGSGDRRLSTQLSEVVGVIERHLEPTLLAVHLYGSAVDGGPSHTVILICWLR